MGVEQAVSKVLVVGGGPAGAVTAALLARQGIRVLLIENQEFPRYHIGESLAPSVRFVLDLAGARDKVDAAGFTSKRGGIYRWGDEEWIIDWPKIFGPEVVSWQVSRPEFDQILLDHARDEGAEVRHRVAARKVIFDGERPVAVEAVDNASGRTEMIKGFDYLVDASGRAGLLTAQHFHNRSTYEIFRNVAIWGYWQGGKLLDGTPQGGINVISSPDGWYWVIPLPGEVYSVGVVMHKTRFAERRPAYPSLDGMLLDLVGESEPVRALLAGGRFTSPARVETDYSYVSERFCGPGHFVVGDAACFLDPLLSTGVHLAMFSATLCAASIGAVTRGEVTESEALGFYEHGYRRAYARMLALVASMYERYRGQKDHFWLARRLIGLDDDPHPGEAFGEIIAGLSDLREAEHEGTRTATARLIQEAALKQRTSMTAPDGTGRPDFEPIMGMSFGHADPSGLHLALRPRLGLSRSVLSTDEEP